MFEKVSSRKIPHELITLAKKAKEEINPKQVKRKLIFNLSLSF